jgi:hypothetical protein
LLKASNPTTTTDNADEVDLSESDGEMEGERTMVEIAVIMLLSNKTNGRPCSLIEGLLNG